MFKKKKKERKKERKKEELEEERKKEGRKKNASLWCPAALGFGFFLKDDQRKTDMINWITSRNAFFVFTNSFSRFRAGNCASGHWVNNNEKSSYPVYAKQAGYISHYAGKYLNDYALPGEPLGEPD